MTEIKIEKKKSMGLWVLLALVVLAVLLYLYFSPKIGQDDNVAENTSNIEETNLPGNNAIVISYVSFVNDDANKMGLDHEYTNSALLKLSNAIEAKASDLSYDVKADLIRAREYADKITTDPFETSHANNIRKAADIFSTALVNMQQAKCPAFTTEAADLKSATASINPEILTLDQKIEVKSFFSKAADLLSKMN